MRRTLPQSPVGAVQGQDSRAMAVRQHSITPQPTRHRGAIIRFDAGGAFTLVVIAIIVVAAADGEEALTRFAKSNFDQVVTDYFMPGMKGDQLAAAMKASRPSQPGRCPHPTCTIGFAARQHAPRSLTTAQNRQAANPITARPAAATCSPPPRSPLDREAVRGCSNSATDPHACDTPSTGSWGTLPGHKYGWLLNLRDGCDWGQLS